MEAKDTVMNIFDKPEECYDRWDVEKLLEAQAKISFEAGVKEVADWIKESANKVTGGLVKPYRFIDEDEWQAKLKEWR